MRSCVEALQVTVDEVGRPLAFQRGRRVYRVVGHLQQWQARTPWWHQRPAMADLRLEDLVWQVEAVCGARRGIFELRQAESAWTLVGIMD